MSASESHILSPEGLQDARNAAKAIRQGLIILYPTDTIWGLGCDATNADAVEKIYRLKQREDSKSMLALLGRSDDLFRWLENVPETALKLIDVAVEPLTIVYDSPQHIATNLLASDGSLGIRITKDRFCQELCKLAGVPIVSTSANVSGMKTPSTFKEIEQTIKDGADYIVGYRQADETRHRPSGIIKVKDDETLTIIR